MCTNPINISHDLEVSCRSCDECLGTRKNSWVARAMAEKATSADVLAITLTYADDDEGKAPLGARVFRYRDFQLFLKRLRSAYFDEHGEHGQIRYICCGEQGSKRGRVHWHVLLFAERSLANLGTFSRSDEPFQEMPIETRSDWSLWPHGFVYVQRPDAGGIAYVLKYAMKDQFGGHKSKGSARFTKSETYAASMFRMSKRPAIGQLFLEQKLAILSDIGTVLPSLQIKVPDYSGYWYPSGKTRTHILETFHRINTDHVQTYGVDCPQWSSLLASLSENEKDLELLINGPIIQEENYDEVDISALARSIADKQSAQFAADVTRRIVKKCGHILPCEDCRAFGINAKAVETEWKHQFREWNATKKASITADYPQDRASAFESSWPYWHRVSAGCIQRNDPAVQAAFKRYQALVDVAETNFANQRHGKRPEDV